MRLGKSRMDDATFDLNLAPMLDIIVAIIPMLLLSVVFVRVTTIETQVPQVVEQAVAAANEKNKDVVQLRLALNADRTVVITVTDRGQTTDLTVAGVNSQSKGPTVDVDGIHKQILSLKQKYPDVFRVEFNPAEQIPLTEIVAVMDSIRTTRSGESKVVFNDVRTGQPIETNLLLPDIVFGNVTGG